MDEAKKEGYSTFVDLHSLSIETRDLRNILEQRGYYAGNMWCVEDVQMNYDASKEEAIEVLDKVFSSEWMSMRIFEMIDEQAYDMGLNAVE